MNVLSINNNSTFPLA